MSKFTHVRGGAEDQAGEATATLDNLSGTVPIDATSLLERCFGNPEFAGSLLDELESSWPVQVEEIQNYARLRDFAAMAEVAHALKGSAGIMCAEYLQDIAKDIELAGRSSETDGIGTLICNLSAELRRCLEGLPRLKETMQLVGAAVG